MNVARAGDNLGWPDAWRCDARPGTVSPVLAWKEAVPPGGAVFYRGDAIPGMEEQLCRRHAQEQTFSHRVALSADGGRVVRHEVYFQGNPPAGYGRLREVVAGPDGALYVTTSNCDLTGTCPPMRDVILRVTRRR